MEPDLAVEVAVSADDSFLYLIVAAVPEHFEGNQTYPYQVMIDRQ